MFTSPTITYARSADKKGTRCGRITSPTIACSHSVEVRDGRTFHSSLISSSYIPTYIQVSFTSSSTFEGTGITLLDVNGSLNVRNINTQIFQAIPKICL
jgi:hypothetical protein